MADAMVSARMSATKKEAGNRVLASLGSNASQVVNELYDYLIAHKALPWAEKAKKTARKPVDKVALRTALAEIESLQVELPPEFANMTTKEARMHRLASKGLLDGIMTPEEIAAL